MKILEAKIFVRWNAESWVTVQARDDKVLS